MKASDAVIFGSLGLGFAIGVVVTVLVVPMLAFAWAVLAAVCLYLDHSEKDDGSSL